MTNKTWEMKDWKIVRSASGKHLEFGYPLGQLLCINQGSLDRALEEVHDPIITNYSDHSENMIIRRK